MIPALLDLIFAHTYMNEQQCAQFAGNPGINPLTGRTIKLGGPTFTKLRKQCTLAPTMPAQTQQPQPGPPPGTPSGTPDCARFLRDPSTNPSTGRKISTTGPTYRRLAKACAGNAAARPRVPAPVHSRARRRAADCVPYGMLQVSKTCWFNAALNGFILGGLSSRIFHDLVYSSRDLMLTEANKNIGTCPLRIGKAYILRAMYHYFESKEPSIGRRRPSRNYEADSNYAGRVARMLFDNYRPTERGGDPLDAAKAILEQCFPGDYAVDGNGKKILTTPPSTTPPASMPTFWIAHLQRVYDDHSIRAVIGPYVLDHAVLSMRFRVAESSRGHAIVAYRCGGKQMLFDSNRMLPFEAPWIKGFRATIKILEQRYKGQLRQVLVSYACYVRK